MNVAPSEITLQDCFWQFLILIEKAGISSFSRGLHVPRGLYTSLQLDSPLQRCGTNMAVGTLPERDASQVTPWACLATKQGLMPSYAYLLGGERRRVGGFVHTSWGSLSCRLSRWGWVKLMQKRVRMAGILPDTECVERATWKRAQTAWAGTKWYSIVCPSHNPSNLHLQSLHFTPASGFRCPGNQAHRSSLAQYFQTLELPSTLCNYAYVMTRRCRYRPTSCPKGTLFECNIHVVTLQIIKAIACSFMFVHITKFQVDHVVSKQSYAD